MKKVSKKIAIKMMLNSNGKFFSVKFIKRTNGKERLMTCRLGVKKYLKGGELVYNPKKKHLLIVFDTKKMKYRSINLDSLYELHIHKNKYEILSETDQQKISRNIKNIRRNLNKRTIYKMQNLHFIH